MVGGGRTLNTEIDESDNNLLDDLVMFQQDGVPSHYAIQVRQLLNKCFSARWIALRGAIEWSATSPDPNPIDLFLWRQQLKSTVYATQYENIQDLQQIIIAGFQSRLCYCIKVDGSHFHQYIRWFQTFGLYYFLNFESFSFLESYRSI